jgi:hypothetical protein
MHTIKMTRDAKPLLKIGRFQPNSFMSRAGKDFASKILESLYYRSSKREDRASLGTQATSSRPR